MLAGSMAIHHRASILQRAEQGVQRHALGERSKPTQQPWPLRFRSVVRNNWTNEERVASHLPETAWALQAHDQRVQRGSTEE